MSGTMSLWPYSPAAGASPPCIPSTFDNDPPTVPTASARMYQKFRRTSALTAILMHEESHHSYTDAPRTESRVPPGDGAPRRGVTFDTRSRNLRHLEISSSS